MKKLLIIACVSCALTGFSQEKKGACSSGIGLYHYSVNDSISDDHLNLNGFYMGGLLYYGSFLNTTTSPDSVTYEITLPFGDSLLFYASWHGDGPCYALDSSDVNSLVTILEGVPFSIYHGGTYWNWSIYDISQEAKIRNSCFFKIQRKDIPQSYFFRVKFLDPPKPLNLPEITNDIFLWLSSENTLSIKADQDAIWEMNLYSLSGQLIQKSTLEGSQDLDISSLPKGCYIARISSENGFKKQLRFIK